MDVFKTQKESGKLRLLLYDDLESPGQRKLHTRVKINYRIRAISFFDYSGGAGC